MDLKVVRVPRQELIVYVVRKMIAGPASDGTSHSD